MRRAMTDAMLTAGSALALIAGLLVIDADVRQQLALRLASNPATELAATGDRVRAIASVIFVAAREQTLAHAPLAIFTLAAVVLVLFMLRT
jgi:hypothetical protein